MSKNYSMFSEEGDEAVHKAVQKAADKIESLKIGEADQANDVAHQELNKVEEDHPEVWDTAVRESYINRLYKELENRGIDASSLNLSIYH